MPRRNKKVHPLQRWLTWGAAALVMAWGLWQFPGLYAAIMRDVRRSAALTGNATPSPVQTRPDAATQVNMQDTAADGAGIPDSAAEPPEDTSPEALAKRAQEIDSLIDAADDAGDAGDILARRDNLNRALALIGESARGADVRTALALINAGVFLGPDVMVDDRYAPLQSVEPGDTFGRIARRYHLTPELVGILNPSLAPQNLKPGDGLKIVFGPYHARIITHELRLDLYARDMYIRSFSIALDDGTYLPTGTYRASGRTLVATVDGSLRRWVSFEGLEPANQMVKEGCFFDRTPRPVGNHSGVRMSEADLATVYNVMLDGESLVRVDP